MMSISLVTVIIFATCCAILGVILLRIGVRGKLISPNPHCRKCKFDLAGHALDEPTPCPECGTTLRTNTPAITDGLQKTRKFALLASIIFLLTAMTCFAWPKLSKLPSIQNINIYNHFPESLLVKLATTGGNKALNILHDRLIPGEVSDEALQTLVSHALELQADQAAPWDQWWGDVLMYAFLEEAMTDQQLQIYLERTQTPSIYIHKEVGPNADEVYYTTRGTASIRGEPFSNFVHEWHRITQSNSPSRFWESPFELDTSFLTLRLASEKPKRHGGTSGTHTRWRPYAGAGGGGLTHFVSFPLDQDEIQVIFSAEFTVRKNDTILHTWEVEIKRTVRRANYDVHFGSPITENKAVERTLSQIYVLHFPVPTQISEARRHEGTRNSWVSFQINAGQGAGGELEHDLLGTISVQVAGLEIPFQDVSLTTNTRLGIAPGPDYLSYFEENPIFWAHAIETGMVDVIIRPRPDLLESRPMVESFINRPIIFRDVPVQVLTPTLNTQSGAQSQQWMWDRTIKKWDGRTEIFAEILE
ncbi:MAG: hypothetical protein ACSHX5_12510 [Phycisphaerales bacterium]